MTESNVIFALSPDSQTIFALATPPGRSGVAVIRISGPAASAVLGAMGVSLPIPRMADLRKLRHPLTDAVIDQAIVLYFPAPHSFTGEDVVELHVHGSRAVIRELIALLSQQPNCRLAEPGEFSRRAFINEKMDLVEAEGLADLIDAETQAQRVQAIRQMQGHIGKTYDSFRDRIIHALAFIEAYIDFPDEEIPPSVIDEINSLVALLIQDCQFCLADGHRGEKIRDGVTIVILGVPNAGKSSLLNSLARRDAAIVSDIAGTTRDLIEVEIELAGYAVTVIDTAGLRETDDPVESEGIRRARQRAEDADIKIVLFDGTGIANLDAATICEIDDQTIVVVTKSDLTPNQPLSIIMGKSTYPISTYTGDGLDNLLLAIQAMIEAMNLSPEASVITRARHRHALEGTLAHLEAFSFHTPIEIQAEELRLAANYLAKITGKISVDEILDSVFSQFCIGK